MDSMIAENEEYRIYVHLLSELRNSDYLIIKIAEAEALGDHDEAERIKTEHADTITRRAALRKQINLLKDKWEGTN